MLKLVDRTPAVVDFVPSVDFVPCVPNPSVSFSSELIGPSGHHLVLNRKQDISKLYQQLAGSQKLNHSFLGEDSPPILIAVIMGNQAVQIHI